MRGSIWPKRSSTPAAPKSGEQEEKTAPSAAVAAMTATDSGMFGRKAATRSPSSIPAAASACEMREASSRSRSRGQTRRSPSSRRKTIAGASPRSRSRFSA